MNPAARPPRLSAFLLAFSFFPFLAFSYDCASSCANIGHVSYPFGAGAYCGYPGFQLSCGTESAQWMLDLAPGYNMPMYYVVDRIDVGDDRVRGGVSLSWSMGSDCSVFAFGDSRMNSSLFAGANLAVFNTSKLTYSEVDVFLLLDCTHAPEPEDQYCTEFEKTCPQINFQNQSGGNQSAPIGKCTYFAPVNRTDAETELTEALEKYGCSFYRSFVNDSSTESSFELGVELNWTLEASLNSRCADCENSNGVCGYNNQTGYTFVCYCDNNPSSSTVCQGCTGVACSKKKMALVIVLPATAVASIALFIVCFVRRRRLKVLSRSVRGGSSHHFVTERGKSFAARFGAVAAREFSFEELERGTQSFSEDRLLGDGGFGAVYQGTLYDNRQVAVKRLYHDNFRRIEQFYNEIRILSSLRHSNLVKLYGYCCEDDKDLLLVFEYVSNGTVADHLHNPNAEALPWKIRLKIASETAEALSYLHNDVNPPIYHRDVKSTNILLEQDFHVKLADFGLSRLVPLEATHVSTLPQGTPGYLDPDYHHSYQLTDKSDVYSFGVVLMELISAMPAVDMSRSRGEINLSSLALSKIVCGAWQELVDPQLKIDREPHVEAMVRNVAELAFRCLNAEKDNRPTMKEVVKELATIRESGYGVVDSPFSVNVSFDTKESNRSSNNDKILFSPTSVHSPLASSNNSSADSSSLLLNFRGFVP